MCHVNYTKGVLILTAIVVCQLGFGQNHQGILPSGMAASSEVGPHLSAKSVIVLDQHSNKVLLARNIHEIRSIASLTKLMAALVFMDRGLKLDQGTVITRDDWRVGLGGCRTRLELNWTYRNSDLLHAALLASDNRAISALARAVGLSSNALVQAMNERARRMKLTHTKFLGPAGIEAGNVSTASEFSRIVSEAGKHPVLKKIMNKREHKVIPMRGYLSVFYRNTNAVVGTSGLTFSASKTGYNHTAGYCLATVVNASDMGTVIVVLLGSKKKHLRVADFKQILAWLRRGYHPKTV